MNQAKSSPSQLTQPQVMQPVSLATNTANYSSWNTSEQHLLGGILGMGSVGKGRKAFAEALDSTGIQATDFFTLALSIIWHAMHRLYHSENDIDLSTVWAEIQKGEEAKKHVTIDMLTYIANQKSGGHKTHARNIVDASVSNAIKNAFIELKPMVDNQKISANEKLLTVNKIVTELSRRTEHASRSQTANVSEGVESFFTQYQSDIANNKLDIGISTGFPRFDHYIDGWHDGTLNVIAGPPGSGKTVFLMTSALHAVMDNKRVLIVQVELSPQESYRRLLCAFAGVDSERLKRHQLNNWERDRLPKAIQKFKEYKQNGFTLLTMNQPKLEDINIKLDTLMMDGYDIIFFDYAGGAKIEKSHHATDDTEHHRNIYRTIDSWKSKYNVPVVSGAQYGDKGDKKQKKHPGEYSLSMIHSSGFIADNAHTITFLHPDKPEEGAEYTGKTSFVIVKNRDGQKPMGANLTVPAQAEMNMFRFVPASSSFGNPQPLWEIHEQNKPTVRDLRNL